MEEQKKQELKIKVRDEDLKGVYSNLMQVFHTKEEFVLDFFIASPPQGVLASRVVVSPGHLKRMIKALQQNLQRYEQRFGSIEPAEEPERKIGFSQNQ